MSNIYKHQVISKASSSQMNNEDPNFYGYVYSEEDDGHQRKEKFVDFKNLEQFNHHMNLISNENDDNISIFDKLKRDFPVQKPYIIHRTPTPYPHNPKQLKMKMKKEDNKKKKKIGMKKDKKKDKKDMKKKIGMKKDKKINKKMEKTKKKKQKLKKKKKNTKKKK